MNAREHNKMIGIFLMVHGGLQAVVMLLLGLIYGGIGVAMLIGGKKEGEQIMGVVFIAMIVLLFGFSLVLVLPQVIGGIKLFRESPNARGWGIAGSIVSCLSFPFGTAAGVYGLWSLFGDEGRQFYLGGYQAVFKHRASHRLSWQKARSEH
jgi:hypothetical protein